MLTRRRFAVGVIAGTIRALCGATAVAAKHPQRSKADASLTLDVDGPYLAPTS